MSGDYDENLFDFTPEDFGDLNDLAPVEDDDPDGYDVSCQVYNRYYLAYSGEIQGCCILIADEIQKAIGGEVVAGYLVWPGDRRRTHWWVELDGEIFDPMADALFDEREPLQHEEAHRDRAIFASILPQYERWRAA